MRTWCEHQRCITVRFSPPGRPGVKLDAIKSGRQALSGRARATVVPCYMLKNVRYLCVRKWALKPAYLRSLCGRKVRFLAEGLIYFESVNGQSVARSDTTGPFQPCRHHVIFLRTGRSRRIHKVALSTGTTVPACSPIQV